MTWQCFRNSSCPSRIGYSGREGRRRSASPRSQRRERDRFAAFFLTAFYSHNLQNEIGSIWHGNLCCTCGGGGKSTCLCCFLFNGLHFLTIVDRLDLDHQSKVSKVLVHFRKSNWIFIFRTIIWVLSATFLQKKVCGSFPVEFGVQFSVWDCCYSINFPFGKYLPLPASLPLKTAVTPTYRKHISTQKAPVTIPIPRWRDCCGNVCDIETIRLRTLRILHKKWSNFVPTYRILPKKWSNSVSHSHKLLQQSLEIVRGSITRKYCKIDGKWTPGGLKSLHRVAVMRFQPSQRPFPIDFPSVPGNTFRNTLYDDYSRRFLETGWWLFILSWLGLWWFRLVFLSFLIVLCVHSTILCFFSSIDTACQIPSLYKQRLLPAQNTPSPTDSIFQLSNHSNSIHTRSIHSRVHVAHDLSRANPIWTSESLSWGIYFSFEIPVATSWFYFLADQCVGRKLPYSVHFCSSVPFGPSNRFAKTTSNRFSSSNLYNSVHFLLCILEEVCLQKRSYELYFFFLFWNFRLPDQNIYPFCTWCSPGVANPSWTKNRKIPSIRIRRKSHRTP